MKVLKITKDIFREWSFTIVCLAIICLIISLIYIVLTPILVIAFGLIFALGDKLGLFWSVILFALVAFAIEFIRRYKKY